MADSNKPIIPGGDTVGTVGEIYLSKNGKTYECVAVIDNTTITPNGETIPKVEYVWVCTDDGAGGGAFPFAISDAEPITIGRTKEELIAAIDAGKTPIGYWSHTQDNGTVIRLFHFMKRFNATDGVNLTFYFSDKTSSGVLDIRADGTVKRTYQNNDGGGASGSANFTFTITPVDGQVSPTLSATRAEMLAAIDAGKTVLGYWTETRTITSNIVTTDKHEFRLESVNGTGADRGLTFVNYEQFYKSTLYVNGNDTISFVDKEVLPAPMTKTEAMTQSVGMDDDGRLWTEPGASGNVAPIIYVNKSSNAYTDAECQNQYSFDGLYEAVQAGAKVYYRENTNESWTIYNVLTTVFNASDNTRSVVFCLDVYTDGTSDWRNSFTDNFARGQSAPLT